MSPANQRRRGRCLRAHLAAAASALLTSVGAAAHYRFLRNFCSTPARPNLARPHPSSVFARRPPGQPWEPGAAASPLSCSCCRYVEGPDSGPMTRFAVFFLPAAMPLPFFQESWGPEGQIALEAARCEAECCGVGGRSRRARSGRLSRRFPGGGAPRCWLPGPRIERGPSLRRTEEAWSRMGASL